MTARKGGPERLSSLHNIVEAGFEPRSLVLQSLPGLNLMEAEGVGSCMEKQVQDATCLVGTPKQCAISSWQGTRG